VIVPLIGEAVVQRVSKRSFTKACYWIFDEQVTSILRAWNYSRLRDSAVQRCLYLSLCVCTLEVARGFARADTSVGSALTRADTSVGS